MSNQPLYPLIFTDLDGTLLDHETYSAKPADALIKKLHDASIAHVIPVTSKTQAELSWLEREIPFHDSIKVSENGSVIHTQYGFPFSKQDSVETIILSVSYQTILNAIKTLPENLRCHINSFSDMTADIVANHTGLLPDDAQRAKQRQATEPFLWSGTAEQLHELKKLMAKAGVNIQRGGRFHHLTGAATKEMAMKRIVDNFKQQQPEYKYITIALGDGPNDLKMIEAADFGVIIPNTNGAAITSNASSVRLAQEPGPKGWVTSVTNVLKELGLL
jgi:mannosyl-3-phosphoglycerate phosphatase family protein